MTAQLFTVRFRHIVRGIAVAALLPGLLTPAARAGDAPREDRFAWGENIGWINFEGQPDGVGRVRFFPEGLSGFAWGENVGWINMGQGGDYPPADQQGGPMFVGDASFGVRIEGQLGDAVRPLSGWAWGENIGWVNFNTWDLGTLDSSGQPAGARIEGERLRGFVWGENVGWVNLDDDEHFVSVPEFECGLADLAEPFLLLDLADVVAFGQAFLNGSLLADLAAGTDLDGQPIYGVLDLADINAFVNSFLAGCQ